MCQRLLAEWQQHTQSVVQQSQQAIKQDLDCSVHSLLTKYDEGVQQQFRAQQADIAKLYELVADLKRDKESMWKEVSHLRSTTEASCSPETARAHKTEQTFDQQPNESIIRVNCKEHVDKEAVEAAITPWLQDGNFRLGHECELRGSDTTLAKNWTLSFAGEAGTSARRVKKALDLLRGSDGTWRRLELTTPLGRVLPIFLSADKNRKRILTETYVKKLFNLVKPQIPMSKGALHMLKAEGLLAFRWKPLARVVVSPDSSFLIYWNPPVVAASGINKEQIVEAMESRTASVNADAVEWQL
jgi:hypothetical protein